MRKKLIIITVATLIGLMGMAGIGLSFLANIDRFRPQLARALSTAVGRQVAIGRISLAPFSASATVRDLSIADDPAFSHAPFVTAREVRVGIALLPLVMSKHLQIESLRLLEPHVTLRRSAAGAWNFATFGAATAPNPPPGPALTLSIDRLRVIDGQVVVETQAAQPSRAVFDRFAIDVRDFSSASRFPFTIDLRTPGGGSLKSTGQIGPIGPTGIGTTPLEAVLEGAHIDIARAGLVDPAAGPGGTLDLHSRITSDGARINMSGRMRGDRLRLVPGGTSALSPVEVAYASDFDLTTHEGTVKQGDVRVGGARVQVRGRFHTHSATPVLQLTLTGHQLPLTDLQSLLPAIGATLPRGARFRSGMLDTDLTARGPIDRLVIAGPVAMSDAILAGFDLGSRMQAVASLAGLRGRGETEIQTLKMALRVAPEGIATNGLTCVVPSLGRVEGNGTIAANGALDFTMLATFTRTAGIIGEAARVASFGRPDAGVPFRITGTTSAPVFVPDVRRVAAEAVKDPGTISKAAGFVRSLFGRK